MRGGPGAMAEARLLPDLRRERLTAILRRRGTVRVAELAAATNVTALTVRRDLKLLESAGLIERVHGGARLTDAMADPARGVDPAFSRLPGGPKADELAAGTVEPLGLNGQIAM
ncbi:MAG: DeoR family transcriptional regulator, partial [Bifidobacteriaceae bacterium]|nr:DeoR family transcriptional regulator [Bifidobacteriaceae bacterium]